MDRRSQFSANFDAIDALGLPTTAPIRGVRDVLICVNSGADVSPEDLTRHAPIASSSRVSYGPTAGAAALGDGLRIDWLPNEDAGLVMNACTPRGHFFAPIRQFSQQYTYIRDVGLDEWTRTPFQWDTDGLIVDALMLSRLVRDNAASTRFAARIADFEDGEQTVAFTLSSLGHNAYRFRRDRDWLDEYEGAALRNLIHAFRTAKLPSRVERAVFRCEYASHIAWADIALSILVSGFEALLKTDRHGATNQFKVRVSALAGELGFEGVDAAFCARMYDGRSDWVHGAHVQLFSVDSGEDSPESEHEGPKDAAEHEAVRAIAVIQDVLRAAVRRCIEDETFRAIFEDDMAIRARWPA